MEAEHSEKKNTGAKTKQKEKYRSETKQKEKQKYGNKKKRKKNLGSEKKQKEKFGKRNGSETNLVSLHFNLKLKKLKRSRRTLLSSHMQIKCMNAYVFFYLKGTPL